MKKRAFGLALGWLLAAGLGACGSSNKADCNSACTKVYTTCGLVLKDGAGNDIPVGQCVSLCNGLTASSKQGVIDCVMAAQCGGVAGCIPIS